MPDDERISKIDDYLHNRLSEEKAAAFRRQMEQEPALAEEVARYHLALDAEQLLWKRELAKKIAAWDEEEQSHKKKDWRPWGWGSIVLILGAIIWWVVPFIQVPTSNDDSVAASDPLPQDTVELEKVISDPPVNIPVSPPDKPSKQSPPAEKSADQPATKEQPIAQLDPPTSAALEEFYKPLSNLSRSEGASAEGPSIAALTKADSLYQLGAFSKAVEAYQEIDRNDDFYMKAQEALGHTAMRLKDYTLAQEAFQAQLDASVYPDTETAQWNLLMAYLGQYTQQKASFQSLLNEILADDLHNYHSRAKRLAETLRLGE